MSRIPATNEVSIPSHPRILAEFGKAVAPTTDEAREAFAIFKQNPFDRRLRSHKIHRLSARYGRIIYAAEIETDLRVIFYIEGTTVVTVEIGSHAVYRAKLHAPIESGQSK